MPLTSFYTALTGINNSSTAINVIGDNLANMNTTAFKSGTATFSEMLAGLSGTSASGNPISFGLGSTLDGIIRTTTQGTINSTGNSTDAAINGNGFFIVDVKGGMGFTRSGAFQWDKDGNLLSSDGFQIMGYPAVDGQIDSSSALSTIQIKKGQIIPPNITKNMSISANLNADATVGTADGTLSAPVQIYDSLGTAHTVTVTFTKTGAGAWDWSATIPAADTGGAAPEDVGSGSLTFDDSGKLNLPAANPTLSLTGLANGAADMDVNFNLSDSLGNSLITDLSKESGVASSLQDGYGAGILTKISINSDGVIIGTSDGGQSVSLAQIILADFPNVQGLEKYQGSTFVEFPSSGEPSIGAAGTGGRGSIMGSSLEQSNVDMAQEFVNLIQAQRAYQASSKLITTSDDLYQDAINMKR